MQYFRIVETDGEEGSLDSRWKHVSASAVVCLQCYGFVVGTLKGGSGG